MQFRDLEQHFKTHQLITIQDVRNAFGDISRVQISRWQAKGLLTKIQKGKYILASNKEQIDKELLANELKNSYISLEYALSYYNIIPEIPHAITSVTTGRGEEITTPMGSFSYNHIMPSLFTGYGLVDAKLKSRKIKIASPSKALFDFFYLRGDKVKYKALDELRLNKKEIKTVFEKDKFLAWSNLIRNPALKSRVNIFYCYLLKYA